MFPKSIPMNNFKSMTDKEFVDFLFSKFQKHVIIEDFDLHDDDSIETALNFQQLELAL